MKASISGSRASCDAPVQRRRIAVAGAAAVRLREMRSAADQSFCDPVEQDLVVGALHQLDLLRHAPGERLLVQRDVAPVRPGDLVGLLDQLRRASPCRSRPGSCSVSSSIFGCSSCRHCCCRRRPCSSRQRYDVGEHVVAVERAGRPAEQVERGVVAARHQDLGEVLAPSAAPCRLILMPTRASIATTAWQIASSLT